MAIAVESDLAKLPHPAILQPANVTITMKDKSFWIIGQTVLGWLPRLSPNLPLCGPHRVLCAVRIKGNQLLFKPDYVQASTPQRLSWRSIQPANRVLDATYGQISALGVVNTRAPRNIGCEIRDAIRYTTPGSRGSEDAIRARHEMTAR